MFYYASKVAWFFATPSNLVVVLVVAGLSLSRVPRLRQTGLATAALSAALVLIGGLTPLSSLVILPLEERFQIRQDSGPVDGIILLGGAVEADDSASSGQLVSNDSAERLLATIALARRHPEARIVISGGG